MSNLDEKNEHELKRELLELQYQNALHIFLNSDVEEQRKKLDEVRKNVSLFLQGLALCIALAVLADRLHFLDLILPGDKVHETSKE